MSRPLAEQLGAIHVRSDVERKRLHGMDALARSTSIPGNGIYSRAATAATYRRLGSLARLAVEHGFSVIVDAAFLKRAEREALRAIAEQCGARFAILDIRAPLDTLRSRVAARAARGNDASEAGLAVLELQISSCEPFTPAEIEAAVKVDGTRSRLTALSQKLRKYLI